MEAPLSIALDGYGNLSLSPIEEFESQAPYRPLRGYRRLFLSVSLALPLSLVDLFFCLRPLSLPILYTLRVAALPARHASYDSCRHRPCAGVFSGAVLFAVSTRGSSSDGWPMILDWLSRLWGLLSDLHSFCVKVFLFRSEQGGASSSLLSLRCASCQRRTRSSFWLRAFGLLLEILLVRFATASEFCIYLHQICSDVQRCSICHIWTDLHHSWSGSFGGALLAS